MKLNGEWREKQMSDEILIPTGEFLYGEDNKPRRLNAYYIDKYPVTNAEYKQFVEATGHHTPEHWSGGGIPRGLEHHPVVWVSWHDAEAYAQWAGKRLPTEAEWEKAARGTDGRLYPWGNEWDEDKCNTWESRIARTTPVGKYSPAGDSPFGVSDLAGNVWEWTADWYDEDSKVLRGGSFLCDSYGTCSVIITGYEHAGTSFSVGFRCARSYYEEG